MSSKPIQFRWIDVALPAVVLILSVILVAYFYRLLPDEVAYHFSDGLPDRWISRSAIVVWLLVPQLFLCLMAAAITWGIARLSTRFQQVDTTRIRPEKVVSLMGNMVALPQVIIAFAMLDIFLYNSYQIHIIPVWMFAMIAMGLGGVFLGIFFVQAMGRAWSSSGKSF